MSKKPERFKIKYSQGKLEGVQILVDKETGVNYISAFSGYAGGLTALLNKDGTPVITSPAELDDD